tara:strand:+ start:322 stop:462 length:141 start_codon:yes stop_codon:yes gene_type:complete
MKIKEKDLKHFVIGCNFQPMREQEDFEFRWEWESSSFFFFENKSNF